MRALSIAAVAVVAAATLASCGSDAGTVDEPVEATPPSQVSETPSVTRPPDPSAPGTPAPEAPKPPPGGPSAPVSISPSGDLVVPAGVTQVPASQIDATALPIYYEHRGEVWVYDDGYSLQMFAAASSGCSDAEAVVVDQSGSAVKITMRPLDQQPGGRPDSGGACTAVMTPRPATVRLDEPLGDRKVYLGVGR